MKRTKNMIFLIDAGAIELKLYAVNKEELYARQKAIVKMLHKKYVKGIYDDDKAIDAFYPCVNDADRLYKKEFCIIGKAFNVTNKFNAAVLMREFYKDQIISGDI